MVELLQAYSNRGRHYETRFDKILHATKESVTVRNSRTSKSKSSAKIVHRLTATDLSDITVRYQEGCSSRQLAESYYISKTSIVILLREAGIPIRRQGLRGSHTDDIINHYATGASLAVIGEAYGVSADTVRKLLLKQGVTLRNPWDRP